MRLSDTDCPPIDVLTEASNRIASADMLHTAIMKIATTNCILLTGAGGGGGGKKGGGLQNWVEKS